MELHIFKYVMRQNFAYGVKKGSVRGPILFWVQTYAVGAQPSQINQI